MAGKESLFCGGLQTDDLIASKTYVLHAHVLSIYTHPLPEWSCHIIVLQPGCEGVTATCGVSSSLLPRVLLPAICEFDLLAWWMLANETEQFASNALCVIDSGLPSAQEGQLRRARASCTRLITLTVEHASHLIQGCQTGC